MVVDYEKSGHLVIITLNRPDKLNAINEDMQVALAVAWQKYQDDEDAWLAILTANGKAFCSGADKSWFERSLRGEDSLGLFLQGINRDIYWSGRIDKPTIAAVNGLALGAGVDMVLQADLRVASEDAAFRLPEVDRGNVLILWDNLPYAIAAELAVGTEFSARRAHEVGMINRLAPAGKALAVARAWADELLAKPPLVLERTLKVLRGIKNRNAIGSNSELRDYTTGLSKDLVATEDWKESVDALLKRRTPRYLKR